MSVNGVAIDKNAKPLAPNFSIENDFGKISLNTYGGKYLLVQFWDGTDAHSRIKNIELSKLSSENGNIEYAGVYTGEDSSLFHSSLTNDGVDVKQQYFLGTEEGKGHIYADYRMSTGNHTCLIAPNERIAAINPSAEEIEKITKQSL